MRFLLTATKPVYVRYYDGSAESATALNDGESLVVDFILNVQADAGQTNLPEVSKVKGVETVVLDALRVRRIL